MCWVPPNAASLRKFQVVAFDTQDTEPVSRGGLQHSSGVPWEKALGSKKLKSTHNNLDQGGLCGQTRRHSEPKAGRSRASEGPEPGSISLPSVLTPACFSFSHTLAPPSPVLCTSILGTCTLTHSAPHFHLLSSADPETRIPGQAMMGCLGQVTPPAPGCSGPGGRGTV